jgi:hypothetical protein
MYNLYMDLILRHHQTKKVRKTGTSSMCEVKLYQFDELVHLISDFTFDYLRFGVQTQLSIHHGLTINLKNGDIQTYYQLSNYSIVEKTIARSKNIRKKNNFKYVLNLIQNGIYKGEKKRGYWGVKYERTIDNVFKNLYDKIKPHLSSDYHKEKNYYFKHSVNPIFDMLVDFHLTKKRIKAHDSVYNMIQTEYPKIKWLKLNEHKFLPSVLDSYGIKSKYLIGEINKSPDKDINILSLAYLCNLFGDSHIDYLKKFNWVDLINDDNIIKKKFHTLKNNHEKITMVNLINDWYKNPPVHENFIDMINNLFMVREFLESKGITLKFNASNVSDVELLLNKWKNLKNNFKRGYSLEYSFNQDFSNYIENDIIIDSEIFKVKILKTEEDFFTEGYVMKNCMSKQFNKGVIFLYLSMSHDKNRINLEYQSGNLITCYGKANSAVDKKFTKPIEILTSKLKEYRDITWTKEKKKIEFKNFD